MGLIHTTRYLDFPIDSWKQISVNPTIFEVISDSVSLKIYDTSSKERKLAFSKDQLQAFSRKIQINME